MVQAGDSGERSSLGMDGTLAAALSYVFGIISGLLFFLLEKRSRFVRFHALQSVLFSVALFACSMVSGFMPLIGPLLAVVCTLGGLILWIVLMVKAYQGELFKLPALGDIAEKNAALPAA